MLQVVLVSQSLGIISNIICMIVVGQMCKVSKTKGSMRPKVLMASVTLSDTILTLASIIPRFLVIQHIKDSHPLLAHLIQSLRLYLENLSLYVEAFVMVVVVWDRYATNAYSYCN